MFLPCVGGMQHSAHCAYLGSCSSLSDGSISTSQSCKAPISQRRFELGGEGEEVSQN